MTSSCTQNLGCHVWCDPLHVSAAFPSQKAATSPRHLTSWQVRDMGKVGDTQEMEKAPQSGEGKRLLQRKDTVRY